MKKTLHKLTFIAMTLLTVQISFGQLVVVPLSNATGGTPHYGIGSGNREFPINNINDPFLYDPDTPTNTWPNTNASADPQNNYFQASATAADNWWECVVSIPTGKSIKYMDFYGRDYNGTNSGQVNRFINIKITLSNGGVDPDEVFNWSGLPESIYNDGIADNNHARMDFVAQGFSATMLQKATSIRLDHISDNDGAHLEFMELRLAAESTLGVDDLKATKLVVSPNPLEAGNQLMISLTNNSNDSNKLLQVYSIIGKEVYKTNIEGNDFSIDYNVFPSAGLYLVKIGSFVSKVIIK